jgi:dienelactone hydrolase
MTYKTYEKAYTVAMSHYRRGEFAEAFEIFNSVGSHFPDQRTEIDYLRSCLAVRVNDYDLAYKILDAFYADGIWFSERILRESPSYQLLQGKPEFEQRVMSHAELRTRSGSSAPAQLHFLIPARESELFPVIFHLHGNGSYPTIELPSWQPAVNAGWLVAAPSAKDALWAGGNASWPDHESAERQISVHFATLKKEHRIDETRIILTGFSMGGDVALAQTLKGDVIKARGFLVVGPGGPMIDDPENFRPLIEAAQGHKQRGVIMVSRADGTIDPDKAAQLAQLLNDSGIPCQFIEYPDEGHVYPADFASSMLDAVTFILGN